MSVAQSLGLTDLELDVCQLCIGSGAPPMYFELGIQCSSLSKSRNGRVLPERVFHPQFVRLLKKGLVAWCDDNQGARPFQHRRYAITDRGWMAVADVAIAEGEDYTYYKTFDGSSHMLNKLQSKGRRVEVKFKDRKQGISVQELFRNMPKRVQEKIKAANPNWKSMVG